MQKFGMKSKYIYTPTYAKDAKMAFKTHFRFFTASLFFSEKKKQKQEKISVIGLHLYLCPLWPFVLAFANIFPSA
jgi:hypothetical protein